MKQTKAFEVFAFFGSLLRFSRPYRLQGQKTIIFEVLEQLQWHAPDWIALPAGNLGNALAFGLAIHESHALGLIDKKPRLLLVQASGAAPFARSFRDNFRRHAVSPETVATAIRIGDLASYDRAVTAIRDTNGVVIDVSDDDILAAKSVIDRAGVGCESASAAALAGVRRMVRDRVLQPNHSVVAILTGHLLKDL